MYTACLPFLSLSPFSRPFFFSPYPPILRGCELRDEIVELEARLVASPLLFPSGIFPSFLRCRGGNERVRKGVDLPTSSFILVFPYMGEQGFEHVSFPLFFLFSLSPFPPKGAALGAFANFPFPLSFSSLAFLPSSLSSVEPR